MTTRNTLVDVVTIVPCVHVICLCILLLGWRSSFNSKSLELVDRKLGFISRAKFGLIFRLYVYRLSGNNEIRHVHTVA